MSVIARAWSLSLVLAPPWPTTSAWARPAGPGAVTLSPAPGRRQRSAPPPKGSDARSQGQETTTYIYIVAL